MKKYVLHDTDELYEVMDVFEFSKMGVFQYTCRVYDHQSETYRLKIFYDMEGMNFLIIFTFYDF